MTVDEENTAFSVDGRKNVDNCDGGTMVIDNSEEQDAAHNS